MITFADRAIDDNRAMKTSRAADLNLARQIRENTMGKWKQNPKYNVFTLRADDNLAEQIRDTARGYHSTAEFLEEAIREKLAADAQHNIDEVIRGTLRRL